MTSRSSALAVVAPMGAAVAAFGVSFGVLAVATGFPAWQAVLMSTTVSAGSSQFAAVASIANGSGAVAAVVSGLVLNSRFVPMSAVAGPHLPGGRWRRLSAHLITDESFAVGVTMGSPERPDGRAVVVAGVVIWAAWVVGTAVGTVIGPMLGGPERLGLDAAFPAMFVALLWPMLRRPDARWAAGAGVVVALVLSPVAPAGVPLSAAALVGLALSR